LGLRVRVRDLVAIGVREGVCVADRDGSTTRARVAERVDAGLRVLAPLREAVAASEARAEGERAATFGAEQQPTPTLRAPSSKSQPSASEARYGSPSPEATRAFGSPASHQSPQ